MNLITILSYQELQTNDALAVEATSYALLTLFLVEGGGVTVVQVSLCLINLSFVKTQSIADKEQTLMFKSQSKNYVSITFFCFIITNVPFYDF